jgi:dihydroxy-acid dehydratase
LSRKVPNICKVAPASDYHVEDVHRAGGIFTILGELERAGLFHRDVHTVHSENIGEAIDKNDLRRPTVTPEAKKRALAAPGGVRTKEAFSQDKYFEAVDDDREGGCVRGVPHAYSKDGGLAVLYGNIAEEGCIVKTAGVPDNILKFSGPARVESADGWIPATNPGMTSNGDHPVQD